MAYWINKTTKLSSGRQLTYIMDNDDDLSNLPGLTTSGVQQGLDMVSCLPCEKGSRAFSISSGKTYMLDSNDEWIEVIGTSSGGSVSGLEPIF